MRSLAERTAWLGAHARSTEEFIKEKQFARAAEELDAWQRQFSAEKLDGYLTLLTARYWAGRGKHAQAIAQADRLLAVNPDSPYMDQLLLLAADSEMRLGRKDRALATLHSLVKDYPGSPLAPLAKKNIGLLEGESGGRGLGIRDWTAGGCRSHVAQPPSAVQGKSTAEGGYVTSSIMPND